MDWETVPPFLPGDRQRASEGEGEGERAGFGGVSGWCLREKQAPKAFNKVNSTSSLDSIFGA